MASQEQEEEESEEPSWWSDLKLGGSMDAIDLEEDGLMGWASPPGDNFQVRTKDYLDSKVKAPAGRWLLQPLGVDWLRSTRRIDEVLGHPDNRIMRRLREAQENGEVKAGNEPFVWAVNLQIPNKEHHSIVVYYISNRPFEGGSLPNRFLNGDNEFRNSRLKLITNIVRGPWIVKTAVGDHAICILGKQLTCRYFKRENFLEIDVDIGSSIIASAIVHLAISYITTIAVDLAFLIEGRSEDELPEKLLGTVRFSKLELDAAIFIEVQPPLLTSGQANSPQTIKNDDEDEDDEFEDALDTEDTHDSFSSRLWNQMGQGLSGNWLQSSQNLS